MKIYTKTGDKGMTSLLGGTRVSKSEIRLESYGTVDELNSYLGLVADLEVEERRRLFIRNIQLLLFTVGSSLAVERENSRVFKPDLKEEDITTLENAIDSMTAALPEMRNFILPGGHQLISTTHIARTVCRRAERLVVRLAEAEPVEEIVIRYLNRLSDYLFVLARKQGNDLRIEEIPWKPRG